MTEHKDRIEQTIEMFVYAPIGAGLYLKDMGPTFVNMFVARGRAEIDRRQAQVQQRTTTARSIGQVAVAFGVPMVRQRVEREVDNARQRAQTFIESIGGNDEPAAPAPPPRATPRPAPTPTPRVKAPPTTNGVARPATRCRSRVRTHSRRRRWSNGSRDCRPRARCGAQLRGAHRNRRTILGKIDQISA
jgi:hypothetical protein